MGKGKLYYFYSTMNGGKSATLILKEFQFRQSGSTTFVLKPSFDTRSEDTIKSRAIKNELPCHVFGNDTDLYKLVFSLMGQHLSNGGNLDDVCVFVDEVNFATKNHVEQLWRLTRSRYNIKVFCYGLKTNYLNELFEASERLLVLSDNTEELKSKCSMSDCQSKATTHLRYIDDKPMFEGESKIVGDIMGDSKYISVCQTCYYKLKGENDYEVK